MKNRIVFALVLCVGISKSANADLMNGTFAPGPGGSFTTISVGDQPGSVTIPDWTVSGGSVDWIGSYWQAPSLGTYSIDLDGSTPGTLSQDFPLAAGDYVLSFYLSGNPDGGDPTKSLSVSINGVSQSFSFITGSNTKDDMGYVLEKVTFTSTGPVDLKFISTDASNSPYGPVIGDVSVTAVPEPSSLALLGLGGVSLAMAAYRRRRAVDC